MKTQRDSGPADKRRVTALARGLELLQSFREGERWVTHQEITRRTGLPKATVSRLAFTLVELDFLRHDRASGSYGLGVAGLTIGFKVLSGSEVADAARPILDELARRSEAAVSLGVRHQLSMVYVAHSRGQGMLTLGLDVGARIPIESTAMGRAVICSMQAHRRASLIALLEAHFTSAWPAKRDQLKKSAKEYRRHGFVTSSGEWQSDISAVGTAFDLGDGREPYALNIGGPGNRLTRQRLVQELGPWLVEATKRLRERIVTGAG